MTASGSTSRSITVRADASGSRYTHIRAAASGSCNTAVRADASRYTPILTVTTVFRYTVVSGVSPIRVCFTASCVPGIRVCSTASCVPGIRVCFTTACVPGIRVPAPRYAVIRSFSVRLRCTYIRLAVSCSRYAAIRHPVSGRIAIVLPAAIIPRFSLITKVRFHPDIRFRHHKRIIPVIFHLHADTVTVRIHSTDAFQTIIRIRLHHDMYGIPRLRIML